MSDERSETEIQYGDPLDEIDGPGYEPRAHAVLDPIVSAERLARLLLDEADRQGYRLVIPRNWRERLFSWPWRPWHNVRIMEFAGKAHRDGDSFSIECAGPIDTRTAREAP